MSRVYNFSAGPAVLPEEVLEQARDEMLDWGDSGMSVMEMSHRGKEFSSIAAEAESDLRELMAIPENYKVLFLQGGASSQFAMIPMNLKRKGVFNYLNTGSWSKKAIKEAQRFGDVKIVGATPEGEFSVPAQEALEIDPAGDYLHYTPNETIQGIEFPYIPDAGEMPIIADFSSTILSRPVDVSRYGMIYAGAQKNIGPAGLTVVILREDLITEPDSKMPAMFAYKTHADSVSMYNTPPTYSWYLAGLVFKWLKANGGLEMMAVRNERKAESLYDTIDNSGFYNNPVDPACRSWMNVPFTLADANLDATFISEASEASLKTLKGHRSVGGMRASIYNAMPEEGVQALIDFMLDFEKRHG